MIRAQRNARIKGVAGERACSPLAVSMAAGNMGIYPHIMMFFSMWLFSTKQIFVQQIYMLAHPHIKEGLIKWRSFKAPSAFPVI